MARIAFIAGGGYDADCELRNVLVRYTERVVVYDGEGERREFHRQLVAAMRAFVASKFVVTVSNELPLWSQQTRPSRAHQQGKV